MKIDSCLKRGEAEFVRAQCAEKRLAFRQDKPVHSSLKAVGVQPDDIVVGLNQQALEMTLDEFLAYVRRNFLVGDKATLNVIRNGKQLDLPLTLR